MAAKKKPAKPKKLYVGFEDKDPQSVTRLRDEADEWLYHGQESAMYEYRLVRKHVLTPDAKKKIEEG